MWQTNPLVNSKPSGGSRVDTNAFTQTDFSLFCMVSKRGKCTGDTYTRTPTNSCILITVFTGYFTLIKKDFILTMFCLLEDVISFLKARFDSAVSVPTQDLSYSFSFRCAVEILKQLLRKHFRFQTFQIWAVKNHKSPAQCHWSHSHSHQSHP